ncbi:adenosylcobinamide-GDP ribazoletransferase [Chitinibacter bivalviorum]|uniref:Adenosylcobinamide-GDP ribazoletransferase n=1 Tax=Chitinibacter bivalviorum TaxID=2739434 RepID=A0A7H9BJN0_9NEIS|nr:adenosylcobinamide-GDP ribazoletransferase [Chitinibacter bivalviorum]QLG88885.1 adenosylcobinamide-GDP ribazoletransferase [Chitinibacter bivalviorum]
MRSIFDWRLPVLAIQFLTRLPTPQIQHFEPSLLAKSVGWFPMVGLIVGGLLLIPAYGLQQEPWLAAVLSLLLWVWVTGGLHLDGLADMADGLGASHRDPARFLAVLKDPHLGSFGVLSLIMQTILKLILLMLCIRSHAWWAILLIPAWARSGVYSWQTLPALAPGMAEQFGWKKTPYLGWSWWLCLLGLSVWLSPWLVLGLAVIVVYRSWLKHKLGGVTGDCLGAGIEMSESALLICAIVGPIIAHTIAN